MYTTQLTVNVFGNAANNGNQTLPPQQQKALHCLAQTVKAKGLTIGLDVAGSIPGFGTAFAGTAAGIQGLTLCTTAPSRLRMLVILS